MITEDPQEIIQVVVNRDRKSATETGISSRSRTFKIQEIMLGAGSMRKPVPYDQNLFEFAECKAEVLKNGRLRILGSI